MAGRFVFSPVASELLAGPGSGYLPEFGRNARRPPIECDVIARFSTTSSKPAVSKENDPEALERTDTLGMALHLDKCAGLDAGVLVAVNVPLFLTNDPAVFQELLPALREREQGELRASRRPSTGATPYERPDRLDRLVDKYRWAEAQDVRSALLAFGRQLRRGWPASVAQTTYFGNHAYGFPRGDGHHRWGRYRFEPAGGDRTLPLGRDHPMPDYHAEIEQHLRRRGSAEFTMIVELAGTAERLADVASQWPETLRRFIVGRLVLDHIVTSKDGEQELPFASHEKHPFGEWHFDPTEPPAGMIRPPSDEILETRALVYGESARQRGAKKLPEPTT